MNLWSKLFKSRIHDLRPRPDACEKSKKLNKKESKR